MRIYVIGVTCLTGIGVFLSSVHADTISFGASHDNTLYESETGAFSNGAGMHFFAGNSSSDKTFRGLLSFDVAANVPSGATINSVRLTLHMSKTISGDQTVSLHRTSADWGEAGSDAAQNEGGGIAPMPGDATWIHTSFPSSFWMNPGGDFEAAPSAMQTIGSSLGYYTWESPAGMVADVQSWLDDPNSNFGWTLVGNEGTTTTAKRFDTRENPTLANRPLLTIDFTPIPEPATLPLLLLGLSLVGFMLQRKRAAAISAA